MSDDTERFSRHLAEAVPELAPVLEEHLDDNFDELLPHVFFGDVTRWVNEALTADPESGPAHTLLDELDKASAGGSEEVEELIAVSFLENLDDDSPATSQLSPGLTKMRSEILAESG